MKIELKPHHVKIIVENYLGFRIDQKTRLRPIAEARFIYSSLCRKYLGCSLQTIGNAIDRDHSTILYGVRQAENLKSIDSVFETKYQNLNKLVKQFIDRSSQKNLYIAPKIIHPYRLRNAPESIRKIFIKRR